MRKEEQLLAYLKGACPGRQHAAPGRRLRDILGVSESRLHEMVNHLRQEGYPIGSGRDGYFYIRTFGEARETEEHLARMIRGLEAARQGLLRGMEESCFRMWEVAAIARPFFPWPGNKVKLVPFIAPMIPPHVETFLEVFGGSAALSLALKPKKGRLDIYNDVDNDLFNVFCCIKENQHALARELRFLPVHGREPFQLYRNIAAHEADYFKHIEEEKLVLQDRACFTQEQAEELLKVLNDRAKLFDVVRAAAFLLRQYGSYSGTGNSVAVKTLRVEPIIKRFPEVSRRIESIFLENRDALELIGERENPNEVVYADPPYVKAERTYPAEFPKQNHTLLRDLLLKYPGYAIISYNNCPLAWELYRKDFFIFSLVRENPLKKERGAIYKELIITNYDPRPLMDQQLDLFEREMDEKWVLVPVNIPTHTLKTL